ncbi:MAG: rubrerythrin family protein [Chloroflexi bacterium]|nr:rubrerythrin family protein [Chloroflexota bacterium]MBU1662591.1 rubrerythrin family protein [Chloroflexota bacterium]
MKKMTEANLKAAFAGESQAHIKYLAFADKAEKEGFLEAARLFEAIAYAEQVHAINHLKVLGGVGKTVENLQAAIEGENYENTEMYPAFDAVAKLQEEKKAIRSFHYAKEAEIIHEEMYSDAKAKVEAGEDIESAPVYVCPVCGHTAIGEAPDKCPICGLPKEKYKEF